jgi:hypothetical protein
MTDPTTQPGSTTADPATNPMPGSDSDSAPWFEPHVLREYALLADGERGALVGPRGEIAWLCAPHWDSDAVFSSLIGGPGGFAVTPTSRFVWGGYYENDSLIWRSRWITDTGIVECREALAFPGDSDRTVLLRRVIAVDGEAHLRILLQPAAGFGRHALTAAHRDEHGCWHAHTGELRLRLQGLHGAAHATPHETGAGRAWRTELHLAEGQQHDLVLEITPRPFDEPPPSPRALWEATETGWRECLPRFETSLAPRDTRHSYAVLRGLTSHRGGMVAAATMSLPERAEQGRNYDYRYVWIRDQCFAGQAVAADGPHPLLDDAVRFVADRILADGPALQPAYTITGDGVPNERRLALPGYPGGTDILGNHVNAQWQLDAFGEALLLFAAAARHDRLDTASYRALRTAADAITQHWRTPDAGIWELHNTRWAHSRLTCAAGLRAIAALANAPTANAVPARGEAAQWSALADAIVADTATDCLHRDGRWQRGPADPRIDAALLLPAIRGGVPADDPRSRATVAAVRRALDEDYYIYRFRHDARPLGTSEGAFILCGFLTALATHQIGDGAEALRYFERNRAACGPPGLFSEEYDVTQRQLRGNLPQGFVHAVMLETAVRLTRPWPAAMAI